MPTPRKTTTTTTAKKAAPKKVAAKGAAPAKAAPKAVSQKVLKEDFLEAGSIFAADGAYLITMEDPTADSHDVWFVPEGTSSLKSTSIRLEAEGVGIVDALKVIGSKVAPTIADTVVPEPPAPAKAAAKKAAAPVKAAAKKAPAKKAAVRTTAK